MSATVTPKVIHNPAEYSPTVAGRIARIVIPALRVVLPFVIYKAVYNLLYVSYKKLKRVQYYLWTTKVLLSDNISLVLKATLTYKLLPYTMGGSKALENAYEVVELIEQRGTQGAIVECGVAEGGTAAMMAMASRTLGKEARVKWFFDSYEGLPAPTEDDYVEGKTGHFIRPLPEGACLGTIEQVSDLMFSTLFFHKEEIHLIKGWFQDTVPNFRDKVGQIAVLRLDGDWYESVKIPLVNFYENLSLGGVVIIDDYATCFGSRKAVDEFRTEQNITTPLNPDGRGGVWFEKPNEI
jgi:O-methyltransferase